MRKIVIISMMMITPYLMGLFRQSVAQKANKVSTMVTRGSTGVVGVSDEQKAKALLKLAKKAKTTEDFSAIRNQRNALQGDVNTQISKYGKDTEENITLSKAKHNLDNIDDVLTTRQTKITAKQEKKQAKEEAQKDLKERTVNKVKVGPRIGGKRLSFGGDVIKKGDYRSVMKAAQNLKEGDTESARKISNQAKQVEEKLTEDSKNLGDLKQKADEAEQALSSERERTKFETSSGKTLTTGRKIVRFFKPDGKSQVVREAEQNLREVNKQLTKAQKAKAKLDLLNDKIPKSENTSSSNVASAVDDAGDDSGDEFSSTSDYSDADALVDDSVLSQSRRLSTASQVSIKRAPSSRRTSFAAANDDQLQNVSDNAPGNAELQQDFNEQLQVPGNVSPLKLSIGNRLPPPPPVRKSNIAVANDQPQVAAPENVDNVQPQQALPLPPPRPAARVSAPQFPGGNSKPRPAVRVAPPFPGGNSQPKPIENAQPRPVDEAPEALGANQAPDAPQGGFAPPPPPPSVPKPDDLLRAKIPTSQDSNVNIPVPKSVGPQPKRNVRPTGPQPKLDMDELKDRLKKQRGATDPDRAAPDDDTDWDSNA